MLLFALCALMLMTTACAGHKAPAFADLDFSAVDPSACKETEDVTNYVKISVSITDAQSGEKTVCEDIIVRLYPEVAPDTVANFQKLVSEHFYDGLTFHRVVEGFMIQGGDPKGNGTGSSPNKIYGEFSSNGFEQNTLSHERGVISMARSNNPDSASCQFFIVHEDSHDALDGKYAAFGRVVAGMETVDTIAKLDVTAQPISGERSKPVRTPVITSIYFVNYVAPTA